LKVINYLV